MAVQNAKKELAGAPTLAGSRAAASKAPTSTSTSSSAPGSAPGRARTDASTSGRISNTNASSCSNSNSRRSPGPSRPAAGRSGGTGAGSSSSSGSKGGGTPSGPAPRPRSRQQQPALYRYQVLPGNESSLLREALERRPWWEPAAQQQPKDNDQRWNLWAGLNGQRFNKYELLQPAAGGVTATSPSPAVAASRRLVNRLQEHRVVCTKSGLAGVLATIQAAAAPAAPSGSEIGKSAPETFARDPGSGAGDTSWIPETYVVPGGAKGAAAGGAALSRFKAAFSRHAAAGQRIWIAKPTCLNRGNGIEVYDSLERIMEHLRSRPAGSSLIIQKYIERPMLLGGRKFDLRAYVLVGPDGSVWFHKEAYCRTSSTPYDSSDLTNRSSHLTNDAVQKHLDTYNAFEDHCKLSLEQLGPALERAGGGGGAGGPGAEAEGEGERGAAQALPVKLDTRPGCEAGLWGAMRRCVAALFSAAGPLLNPRQLAHCFELLGLDFMLDAAGGLYLIEVNTSPALFRAGSYLADLLPRLIEEVVQKVVDPLFPPPPPTPTTPSPSQAADTERTEEAKEAEDAAEGAEGVKEVQGGAGQGAPLTGAITLLDGFVRVDLDERLGATAKAAVARRAAARAAGAGAAKPARAVSPGPGLGSGSRLSAGGRTQAPMGAVRISASGGGAGLRASVAAAGRAGKPVAR